MRFFINSIRDAIRKPFLIWFMALVMIPISYLTQKYSFIEYIVSPKGFESTDLFDTYLTFLQIIVKYLSNSKNLFILIFSVFFISLIAGLFFGTLFSGYFYVLHKRINRFKSSKNDYIKGIKRYFIKISLTTCLTLFSYSLLIGLLTFIFVPTIVTMNALLAGRAELFFVLVLFIIVTVFVLLLSFTFYKVYIIYWFPSCLTFKKKCFKAGIMVANNHFWKMVFSYIAFDVVFVLSRFIYYSNYINIYSQTDVKGFLAFILFFFNWIFMSIFSYLFVYFVFHTFRDSKETLV